MVGWREPFVGAIASTQNGSRISDMGHRWKQKEINKWKSLVRLADVTD